MQSHLGLRTVLWCSIVLAEIYGLAMPGPMTTSAPRSDVLAAATPGPDCTAWRQGGSSGTKPEVCTVSSPWWTAWSSCSMTPIHSELWAASSPEDTGLSRIPWIRAEPASTGIVGHLYYGNRPLAAGGEFPDGSRAKVLWEFDVPVRGLSITVTDTSGDAPPVVLIDATSESAPSSEWPSFLDIPAPGCWTVTLSATAEAGAEVKGHATFIVVSG